MPAPRRWPAQDALFAASAMMCQLERLAADYQPHGLVTVGQLQIARAARNIIPGQVSFTVDLRHPQDVQISTMEQQPARYYSRWPPNAGWMSAFASAGTARPRRLTAAALPPCGRRWLHWRIRSRTWSAVPATMPFTWLRNAPAP
jgi:acetylornithine deacetylase/succinyl-diaminopimelate desuccinylase-like protein